MYTIDNKQVRKILINGNRAHTFKVNNKTVFDDTNICSWGVRYIDEYGTGDYSETWKAELSASTSRMDGADGQSTSFKVVTVGYDGTISTNYYSSPLSRFEIASGYTTRSIIPSGVQNVYVYYDNIELSSLDFSTFAPEDSPKLDAGTFLFYEY